MNALIVKLGGLAETGQQRDLMRQFHRISVLRALRRAGSALTILQAAARTGLGVYKVESALDSLCAEGLAQRDTARRAWLYHAIDGVEPSAGTASPAAKPVPDAAKDAVSEPGDTPAQRNNDTVAPGPGPSQRAGDGGPGAVDPPAYRA